MHRRHPSRLGLAGLLALALCAPAVPAAAQRLLPAGPPVVVKERAVLLYDLHFGALGTSLVTYSDGLLAANGFVRALAEPPHPLRAEAPFREDGPGIIDNGNAAPLANGDFLVVFAPYQVPSGGYTYGNRMIRYAADGVRLGSDIPVAPGSDEFTFTAPAHILPLADGGWRLFWYERPLGTDAEHTYFTRRYDAAGNPVDGSTRNLGPRSFWDLDWNAAGQVVVAETGLENGEPYLFARRIEEDGDTLGAPIPIAPLPEGAALESLRVAVAPGGGFVVTWHLRFFEPFPQPEHTYAAFVGADGELSGEIRAFEPPGFSSSRTPRADALPDGSFALVLEAADSAEPTSTQAFLYHLSAIGTVLGRRAVGNSGGGEGAPQVSARGDGLIRVVWLERYVGDRFEPRTLAQDFTTACAGAGAVCLANGRFRVEVEWETSDGNQGIGTPRPLTPESTAFWFFREENLELFVKVLDACDGYDRYWVFLAGLTNVAVDITVTDTLTGESRTYSNPQKTPFQPIYDTQAFATCGAGTGGS